MGPVLVIAVLELPERVQKMALVPDERAVQEFTAAGLHPAFHDGVHSRHLDPAGHHFDARLSEDGVEQGGKLAVAVPDQEPRPAPGTLKIHDQVPHGLDNPGRNRMRSRAQDPDLPTGVLDDGQHVEADAG